MGWEWEAENTGSETCPTLSTGISNIETPSDITKEFRIYDTEYEDGCKWWTQKNVT